MSKITHYDNHPQFIQNIKDTLDDATIMDIATTCLIFTIGVTYE